MAEITGCVLLSHSPLYHVSPPISETDEGAAFVRAVRDTREAISASPPDVVVIIGPDHFRNFFYDCMPSICVGTERITAAGDYGTPRGDLPAAPELAMTAFRGLQDRGFDPALSIHIGVDHGIAQLYGLLFPELSTPLLPIMLNTSAPPLPSLQRCAMYGRAVGAALRAAAGDLRLLIVGSGGLSHWPPPTSAFSDAVDEQWRAFLIDGRPEVDGMEPVRASSLERYAASRTARINTDWDRAFLRELCDNPAALLAFSDSDIEAHAGNGGHEVRTWIAAQAAWGAPLAWTDYEPVVGWCTGMGCASSLARPAGPAT
jgi:2,3-dihydroxyphenylpropionate 1,2-dioxygenase